MNTQCILLTCSWTVDTNMYCKKSIKIIHRLKVSWTECHCVSSICFVTLRCLVDGFTYTLFFGVLQARHTFLLSFPLANNFKSTRFFLLCFPLRCTLFFHSSFCTSLVLGVSWFLPTRVYPLFYSFVFLLVQPFSRYFLHCSLCSKQSCIFSCRFKSPFVLLEFLVTRRMYVCAIELFFW